ncbi:poly-gamma-glutamate biosynthesis protein PgsC [Pseudothermotoga sp.]
MLETAVIGILISALFIEFTGFYPGGIVVPVWLSFYIDQPLRILGTILLALLCLLIYKLARRYFFVYGRRRFALFILLSAVLTLLFKRFLFRASLSSVELETVGWIIPGLIANTMERQGIFISIISMIAVSLTIRLVAMVVL